MKFAPQEQVRADRRRQAGAICFAVAGAAVCAWVAWRELASATPRLTELGSLVVLTMTLIVLLWYAYDTNAIARITRDRWMREGLLATTYTLRLAGASVGDAGHTVVQLQNGSPLVVPAKLNFNFPVYGHPVTPGDLYDGPDLWVLYPHQLSQGWFDVAALVSQQGKTIAQMQAETTEGNRKRKLTMQLELTLSEEFGVTRTLPPRPHYFDFNRWA